MKPEPLRFEDNRPYNEHHSPTLTGEFMRSLIYNLIQTMRPHDKAEQREIEETLSWIDSGANLFHEEQSEKHLTIYTLFIDSENHRVLLHFHKQKQQWVPSGGDIQPNEHPQMAVHRQVQETLQISPPFLILHPFFLSPTKADHPSQQHQNVTLWYLLNGNSEEHLQVDLSKYEESRWFSLDALATIHCDPNTPRLIEKLQRSTILRSACVTA